MGKLLDISGRLGKVQNLHGSTTQANNAPGDLVDMTARREAELVEDRRQARRTLLTEFISVHAIIPRLGLIRVVLDNINQKGLAFDIEKARGSFEEGEEVAMRLYMNHQTFFPFVVKIKHITDYDDVGVVRHGCEFVKNSINDVALQHFVAFLESVSAGLRNDHGDVLVSNINS